MLKHVTKTMKGSITAMKRAASDSKSQGTLNLPKDGSSKRTRRSSRTQTIIKEQNHAADAAGVGTANKHVVAAEAPTTAAVAAAPAHDALPR
jgi:hypothetical protein